MAILVGKSCVGKTCLVRMLASLMNQKLVEFAVNNSTDTTDLLGGFEKVKQFKENLFAMHTRIKHVYLSSFGALKQLDKYKVDRGANYKSVLSDYLAVVEHEQVRLYEIPLL
jgi:midasin (ATPase involved in ribosome maturation)